MKKKTAASNPYSIPSKPLTPAAAARIRAKASKVLGVKGDKDSAAGAAS